MKPCPFDERRLNIEEKLKAIWDEVMASCPERAKPVSGYRRNYTVVPLESLGNPKTRIPINKIYQQSRAGDWPRPPNITSKKKDT